MWKVGDRVYVIGFDIYGKIIKTEIHRGVRVYLVREFDHPHATCWADAFDLQKPWWKTHDDNDA